MSSGNLLYSSSHASMYIRANFLFDVWNEKARKNEGRPHQTVNMFLHLTSRWNALDHYGVNQAHSKVLYAPRQWLKKGDNGSPLDLQMAAAVPCCVQFTVQFGAESGEAARTVGARLACRSAVVLQPYTFSPLGRRDGSHCNGYTVRRCNHCRHWRFRQSPVYRQAGAAMKVWILSPTATLSLAAARLMLADVGKLT